MVWYQGPYQGRVLSIVGWIIFGPYPNIAHKNNPENPIVGHLYRKTCRDVFSVDVTLQILIQTTAAIPPPDRV